MTAIPPPLSTDPIDVAIDPTTRDIPPTGNLTMTRGIVAVMQAARIRMAMIAGEWFANLDAGVRYFERAGVLLSDALLGTKFNKVKAQNEIRDNLLGSQARNIDPIPGLVSLTRLNVDYSGSGRQLSISWQGQTVFGDTPNDVLVIGAATSVGS